VRTVPQGRSADCGVPSQQKTRRRRVFCARKMNQIGL
jgi:hypothetical protein